MKIPVLSLFACVAMATFSRAEFPEAQRELTIGRIAIERGNVFDASDPVSRRFPYSWGNAIHVVTSERFIRRELLFREGDAYDPARLVESERLLRARPIFRYVSVRALPPVDGRVDVVVRTEDVWTLSVQTHYGTAGGQHLYRLGVLERNLLGTGKTVGAFVRQDIDRFIKGFSFFDPHLLGSRWDVFFGYGADQKGQEWEGRLERPFASVRDRFSGGVLWHGRDDESRLFDRGEVAMRFESEAETSRVFLARALTDSQTQTRRVHVAWERSESRFFGIRDDTGVFPPPEDRVIAAALLGVEWRSLRYIKRRGIFTFDRDEDVNLGWEWTAEAGPILDGLGATRDGALGRLLAHRAWHPLPRTYALTRFDLQGRVVSGTLEDATARFSGTWVVADWWRENTASVATDVRLGRSLDGERQFLLGGANGLRGYAVRQFSGSKSALVVLENRQNLLYDWLRLVNVGWATFLDTGAVWRPGERLTADRFRSDVGAGVRFSPSRSVDPSIIRADVAYALNENGRASRWVVHIGVDMMFRDVRRRKFDQE